MIPGNFLWTIIGFILTILVFSYLAGDNVLFRIVIYAFVGLSAGYVTLMLFSQVFWPRLIFPIIAGSLSEKVVGVIGLLMSILLGMKLIPRLTHIGNLPIGYMVGVGAAVAIGGAVTGTLIPQILALINNPFLQSYSQTGMYSWEPVVSGVLLILGTLSTLVYFQYQAKKNRDGKIHRGVLVEVLAWFGKIFTAISFGAIFAGVVSAAITAMVERVAFLINFLRLVGG